MGNKSKRRSQSRDLQKPTPQNVTHQPEGQGIVHTRESVHAFQGPIPDPDTLAGYEQIMPGLADRIVTMAEQQGEHRRQLEHQRITAQIADGRASRNEARIGQVFGLVIGLAAIAAGAYLALNEAQWVGGFIGTGGVMGLVAVFVKGRIPNSTNDNAEE